MMADIDPRHRGAEAGAAPGGLRNARGEDIGPKPRSTQRMGDLVGRRFAARTFQRRGRDQMELGSRHGGPHLRPDGRGVGLGPNLAADILGDWREEILVAAPDRQSLRLYTTTIPTQHRSTP
jgi:rhamnogalacturonan endolyase